MQEYSDRAYLRYIEYKLLEELEEYLKSKEPEELADLLEVIYRVGELRGISPDELEGIRQKKALERGGFSKNLVLISVEEDGVECGDDCGDACSGDAGMVRTSGNAGKDDSSVPERKYLLCTCEQGDHVFEDE